MNGDSHLARLEETLRAFGPQVPRLEVWGRRAARAAAEIGMTAWALTGPGPNPLADACAEAITVESPVTCTVQEVHLAAIHIMCAAVDAAVRDGVGALLEAVR